MWYLLSVRYVPPSPTLIFANEDGRVKRVSDAEHRPYFLVSYGAPIPKDRSIVSVKVVEKFDPLSLKTVKMKKVEVSDPLAVPRLREKFQRRWEDNIKYYNTYIADMQLVPGMPYLPGAPPRPVGWDEEFANLPRRLVDNLLAHLDPEERENAGHMLTLFSTPVPRLPRLALDIEVEQGDENTFPDASVADQRVIAVSMAGSDGFRAVYLLEGQPGEVDGFTVESFGDERELLAAVASVIKRYPVLVTFNGDEFDLPYLRNRARRLGTRELASLFRPTRDGVDLSTGVHLDLYRFFRNPAVQNYAFGKAYREFSLDAISLALLGEGKVAVHGRIDALPSIELARYAGRDADLTLRLTTFNGDLVMRLIFFFMRISKLPLEDVARHPISTWIRQMMLWEHRRRNWLFPNKEDIEAAKGGAVSKSDLNKAFKGAIVFQPKPGVHFNVVVLDFASLYPSVIKRQNLSYETVNCPHPECRDNRVPGLPHWVCKRRRGITSLIVGLLRDIRVYVYKPLKKESREADTIQAALKVFINASYGVFGNRSFDLFCGPMAEAVTAYGRNSIEWTRRRAEELGLEVIYGDTDSVFILDPPPDKLAQLQREVEERLSIDLDVDKVYRWVAFTQRKKNYLGLLDSGEIDIKGLMLKKKNTPPALRIWFAERAAPILKSIEEPGDVEKAREALKREVAEFLRQLEEKRLPLDAYVLAVELSKDPEDYAVKAPQVKVAEELRRLGKRVGKKTTVRYVKTSGGVAPVETVALRDVDTRQYVENVKSIISQAFEPLGIHASRSGDVLSFLGRGGPRPER